MTWLVEKASADLVSNNPAIDEVIVFGGKKWMRELGKPGTWLKNFSEARTFFKGLRDARYDAVMELQGLLKSSLLARATGSKVVAGFDDTREFADRFLTHKLNVGDYFGHDVPVVELNLKVAEYALAVSGLDAPALPVNFPLPALAPSVDVKVGALLISGSTTAPFVESVDYPLNSSSSPLRDWTDDSAPDVVAPDVVTSDVAAPDVASVPQMGAIPNLEAGAPDPINIVLIPGTTWVTKIWPNSKWVELAQKLALRHKCRLVLVGGPAEVESNFAIASGIEAKAPGQVVLNLTGQTSLLDLIAVFRRSSLVIGADTGPLHLAAATGVPGVVGVFGSTPAKRNGPYGNQCKTVHLNLECQPCYSKTCKYGTVACLSELAPSEVLQAILNGFTSL